MFDRVSVIVPAYNEVESIAATVNDIRTYFAAKPYSYEIIVAADGEDGTRELVTAMADGDPRLRAIGGPTRRGKGHGIRQGVAVATGDIIGFVDADNKTPISEFDKFERPLQAGCPVVIASRAVGGSRVEHRQPLHRRLGSKAFSLVMHTLVGLGDIRDTQCGFKFFQGTVAREIFGRQTIDGYMFDVEVLVLARQAAHEIVEIPVRWRDDGDSRLQLVRGNLQNARDLLAIHLRRYRQPSR